MRPLSFAAALAGAPLLAGTLLLSLPALGNPAADWPALSALEADGARLTALAVDIETGKALAQRNPRQRLIPASVSKLFVAAAALRHWGPDHRFITRLMGATPTPDGNVRSDLVLMGGADPDLGRDDLRALVRRLRQNGALRISGDLVVDESLLGAVACYTKDRCEARLASSYAYDGPLSAAGIDYGTLEVTVRPAAQVGDDATIHRAPRYLAEPGISGRVNTVAPGEQLAIRLRRESPADAPATLRIRGQIPHGHAPVKRSRSVDDAAAHTGRVLRQLLRDEGIQLAGAVRVRSNTPDTEPDHAELARFASAPLAEQLRRMQHFSNNYMADLLTLHLARERSGMTLPLDESADHLLADGRSTEQTRGVLAAEPIETQPRLDSGSGLSVSSRLSASDLVEMLVAAYDDPVHFPGFYGAMPVPAYSRSPQLHGGDALWQHRIAAKTGWLSEPVGVRAVAGYARTLSGNWIAFAIIMNGTEAQRALARRPSLSAIREDVSALIAGY